MKQLLRTLILLLARAFGAPAVYLASRRASTNLPDKPRILLIRPDHLGDLVLTTPVLEALREHAPNAYITMMVGPWSSEVVARHPAIDHLITCPFPGFRRASQGSLSPYTLLLRTAQQLRRNHYDLAINLRPDFWWGAALLYLAAIPQRIGYAIAPGTPFLTQALPFQAPEHTTVSSLRLASAGLQALRLPPLVEPYTPALYPLHFKPTEEERAWVAQRLSSANIAEETPIVVIHPGTGAAVKLWRNEAWANCANALNSQASIAIANAAESDNPNTFATTQTSTLPMRIILTGSPSERPLLAAIAQGITPSPLQMTDMTIGQLAALLERARIVLGVDNGPLHLAVAQGTPTVQIFGPTDARIFGPWGLPDQHVVIASTQRCSTCPTIPCGRLDFSPAELPDHPCVRLVPEQHVADAITTLLGQNTKIRSIINDSSTSS